MGFNHAVRKEKKKKSLQLENTYIVYQITVRTKKC